MSEVSIPIKMFVFWLENNFDGNIPVVFCGLNSAYTPIITRQKFLVKFIEGFCESTERVDGTKSNRSLFFFIRIKKLRSSCNCPNLSQKRFHVLTVPIIVPWGEQASIESKEKPNTWFWIYACHFLHTQIWKHM